MEHTAGRRIRVLHCITSLDADGAQHMLLKLCQNFSQERFEVRIINLRNATPFSQQFADLGVPVEHFGMRRGTPSWAGLRRLQRVINDFKPDVLQGWMYHSNAAVYAGRLVARHKPEVFWNVRTAVPHIGKRWPMVQLTRRIGALLSHRVAGVVYNSLQVAEDYAKVGYCAENQIVISNGFDTAKFSSNPERYRAVRASLGLGVRTPLVGVTARYHPLKDYPTFLRAAAVAAAAVPEAHFVLAGRDVDSSNAELTSLAAELGISARLHFLGECREIEMLMPAFDVYCLSSSIEGFPNALGEAMACCVPCVTTAAGGAADVVGDTGLVVPVRNPSALGEAIVSMLRMSPEERSIRGARARERVVARFSLPAVTADYENLYIHATRRDAPIASEMDIDPAKHLAH